MVVVVACRVSVLPLQRGPLLAATGVAGGLGFVRVKGPTLLLGKLFSVTLRSAYTPAGRLLTTNVPLEEEVPLPDWNVPSFV